MGTTPRPKVPTLPDGSHRRAGEFDKAGRWYPNDECCVPGSFRVRAPSRTWPFSYLKHYYTAAYSRQLLEQAPQLWLRLQGLDGPQLSLRQAALRAIYCPEVTR